MASKKTIKLDVERDGKNIICQDLTTLSLILGTRGVAGNLKIYSVKKNSNGYVVPISSIKTRIKTLEKNKARIEDYLKIMKAIIS